MILSKITARHRSNGNMTLYEILVQRTNFGSVKTAQGELDVFRQRTAITNHP